MAMGAPGPRGESDSVYEQRPVFSRWQRAERASTPAECGKDTHAIRRCAAKRGDPRLLAGRPQACKTSELRGAGVRYAIEDLLVFYSRPSSACRVDEDDRGLGERDALIGARACMRLGRNHVRGISGCC